MPPDDHAGQERGEDRTPDGTPVREGSEEAGRRLVFLSFENVTTLALVVAETLHRQPDDGSIAFTLKGEEGVNALEAALANPQWDYHPDMAARAAGLFYSIAMGHALNDGNKRLAVVSMTTFLAINGYVLPFSNERIKALALAVVEGTLTRDDMTNQFRKHLRYVLDMTPEDLIRLRDEWLAEFGLETTAGFVEEFNEFLEVMRDVVG